MEEKCNMLILVSLFSVHSRQQLLNNTAIQDATMSVSVGGNVRLSCPLSEGSVTGSNYPLWVHQIPGTKPKHVVGSYDTGNQNYNPVSPRYTASISAVLTITNVQPEDEGTFYCSLWTGSARTV
uniref:Ig-like domain-containing protein n=1 Tax=Pyxicephalus adspersus TaxID=30357 RepID=A0AAV3A9B3_PYXAD|nr:TPA: hypothetical protein GDO54_014008 [Pyxicephalus adspersus]